jgi:NAD(P)-dependent dehydrogenase (short-subunit alcohol dehydrogenase family)
MQSNAPVVFITGCSSGIGKALALEYSRRGHRVFATARRPEMVDGLDQPGIETLPLDVTDAHSIDTTVHEVLRRAGRIDVLVNNAGYGLMGPILHEPASELRRQFETNVFGALAVAQAVATSMIARKQGLIVNVGSISAVLTTPFAGAYCASKAALHALSDAMRLELEPLGIRVVTLRPGYVSSRFGDTASKSVTGLDQADSPYQPIRDFIEQRAMTSQDGAMDTDVFARRTVDALLRRRPPHVIGHGPKSFLLPALSWLLPLEATDWILRRKFGLSLLGR